MRYDLTVIRAFGAYAIGDRITDTDEKKAALADRPSSVVQVAPLPKAAEPQAEPEPNQEEQPAAPPARGGKPL